MVPLLVDTNVIFHFILSQFYCWIWRYDPFCCKCMQSSKWDSKVKFREVMMTLHSSNGHLHSTNKTFTIFKIKLLRQNLSLFPLKQNWPYHILGLFFWAGSAKYYIYYVNYNLGMRTTRIWFFFRHKFLKQLYML